MTAADRERARKAPVHMNRAALSATSVILVGPLPWRNAVDQVLHGIESLAVAADVEGDPREVDIYSIPQADVVLITVDGQRPNHAIEFAMRLQAKDKGTGIALVLPKMSNKNLRTFHTYAGSWSLISASVCGDKTRLSAVLESAGRGISWVDPIIPDCFNASKPAPQTLMRTMPISMSINCWMTTRLLHGARNK
jgi:hypothetical protein